MEWYFYLLIGLGGLLLTFLFIIIIRAILFKPKTLINIDESQIDFDKEKAVTCLQELVRCKTVSYDDHSKEDDAEFNKLLNLLPTLYPAVFSNCEMKTFDGRAILLKWKGESANNPVVLMAHYDVVPVEESNWDKPPFSAIIEDGVLWGRGSVDTKATLNASLFAVNHLIKQGFTPKTDVYLAYSGGEEVNGEGAKNIVDYFESLSIAPAFVLDEGGAVVKNVFPGVKKPCGLIGIAEKGLLNVKYTVKSGGGHASAPKPNSPLIRLSNACIKVEKNPFKFKLTPPVKQMFDNLGRHSTFVYRMIFSNLWLFKGILNKMCIKSGGDLNALCRTTVAFTQADGSQGMNVIPPVASLVSNIRLNPYDDIDSAIDYLNKTIADDKVVLSVVNGYNPSRISRTDVEGYSIVEKAVASTWKGAVVSPYLMVQCSDSRHYGKISDRIYKFSAMDLTSEERASIHGNNERIRVSAIEKAVEFYIRLIIQC